MTIRTAPGIPLPDQHAFWVERLAGALPSLQIPSDYARPPVQMFLRDRQSVLIDAPTYTALDHLCAREAVDSFVVLLTLFASLLHRYSGQDDILIGSVALANEPNLLPLRLSLAGAATVRETVQAVAALVEQAAAHKEYPFEHLINDLNADQDMSRAPLFQAMLVTPGLSSALTPEPLQADHLNMVEAQMARCDLVLLAEPEAHSLRLTCDYDEDLFKAATIQRLLDHLHNLLMGMTTDPARQCGAIPMLTDTEQQQIMVEWNRTEAQYPTDRCLHHLIEEQAQRTPDARAVVFEQEHLTYRDLDSRSNRLARYLRGLGVGPDVLVGVYVERSLDMVVGLLGILKAGGAYVPLDPTYPRERITFMLEDAQIGVLLTQERLRGEAPGEDCRVVFLDSDWPIIDQQPDAPVDSPVTPENLVHVIYTSGSTGKPKGVQIEHRSLVNLLFSVRKWPGLSADDVLLSVTTLSFDIVGVELFLPLLLGAHTVLVSREVASDGVLLAERLVSSGATFMQATPATWKILIKSGWPGLPHLRMVSTGEALPRALANLLLARGAELWDMYGPTETTIWSTGCRVQPGENNVAIGRPIDNTQIYILDNFMQPVPVGVTGHLYIGGDGLARGYLNRPDLTAERFVPNPFDSTGQTRLYRTGDLARYQPDGTIDYLGRSDHQVKIRGFRIELGEIDYVLSQHPDVREAVVIDREDQEGNPRLVAYMVPRDAEQLAEEPTRAAFVSSVRSHVQAHVPGYMVPAALVVLDKLPLTPNGKIDRRALPTPELHRPEMAASYVAPRTPLEWVLAGIWNEVLGVEQVGIDDNFFELGGHSLLATQVVSRLRDALALELPVRAVFETATIASLAARIQEQGIDPARLTLAVQQYHPADADQSAAVRNGAAHAPIHTVPRDGLLPTSFAQQRIWFLDQWNPGNPIYNIPFALHIAGALDRPTLQRALDEIVRRHEVLRTTFHPVEGQPVQAIAPAAPVVLQTHDLRHIPAAERTEQARQAAAAEVRRPFDLAQGPLLRCVLLRLDEQAHVLLLTMHHTIADGWSLGVFLNELAAIYSAYTQGQPVPLHALPIQYADFAAWQRHWLRGSVLDAQMACWQQQLAGELPVLALPTDRPRPTIQTYNGATYRFTLPELLTRALKTLSQQHQVTLFMTLLTAFNALLYRYSGQTDLLVGSPIANRNRSDIEHMIGCFVNTLVLRNDLSGNPTVSEVLRRVQETALAAYANQDVPFEQLVETLQPERDLGRHPLFQVMFSYQNTPPPRVTMPDLHVGPFDIDTGTAKFDLLLEMQETPHGLVGLWEYNTDLFDTATIERMTGHLQQLMQGMVANPGARLETLPLLTAAERQTMLLDWNHTALNYPRDTPLHQLLAAQAQRTPDAVAVVYEDRQLTYAELDQRANHLAHHLRSRGVGPNVLVGICVERSLEMMIGLLGIMKAGGAYVPMDAAYPQERLAFMISDTRMPVLLTQRALRKRLPAHAAQVVLLDEYRDSAPPHSLYPPESGVTADDLVHVIYTSGSTGKPKGVQLQHRSLVNLLYAIRQQPGISADDVLLSVTTLAFDIAGVEFYLPLLVGARTVLVSRAATTDANLLAAQLVQHRATLMQATPSTWKMLLQAGWPAMPPLKMITTGEAMPRELAVELPPRAVWLWNLYGPTETTIWSTGRQVTNAENYISIGRPIANTSIYILDAHMQPVPIGIPGELYIGGDGLARGYLNRPDLTAERFVSNPFDSTGQTRLYRTGDIACYRADGTIDYLGRADHQVKIRGFRIEPGEIEVVLGQHPAVREAVVALREDRADDRRLVAYVVADAQQTTDTPTYLSELRGHLKARLPDYMLPAAFVLLDALPLTTNGKIDRRALPAPDTDRPELASAFAAPRTSLEQELARIWAEVLGLERVGIYDDFFELGGHSLQTMQLVSRISTTLQRQVPVKTVFLYPTIAALAEQLAHLPTTDAAPPVAQQFPTAQPVSTFITIERRPLLSLFATGKVAPIDSAAIGYQLPNVPGLAALKAEWDDDLPLLTEIRETTLGRIGLILLPRTSAELYHDRNNLVELVVEALELAAHMGARCVSLTGLIPSATDYGRALLPAMQAHQNMPRITTGHETTTATVLLNIARILEEAGRSLKHERVGFLGLGSIGTASLRLMLRSMPHPTAIVLCDLYSKREELENLRQEIIQDAGFQGEVSTRVVHDHTTLPPEFYDATLMVGATNVPDILDIDRLRPGTLIVDDSGPHCFNPEHTIQRFEQQADILFTEGGVLTLPEPIALARYLPRSAERMLSDAQMAAVRHYIPQHIMGCVLASLLCATFDDMQPTVGHVQVAAALNSYRTLQHLGFRAADLHCDEYTLSDGLVKRFRQQYHP